MAASSIQSPFGGAVAGLVLAGGRSVRFGGEKAVAVLSDRPLLMWAVERLKASCALVGVNARPGSETEALAQSEELTVLYDAPEDANGPLAGVKAGLAWAAANGAVSLAISPCDAPLLPHDLFSRLIDAAGPGAAMAVTSEGRQPLCSLWPISALPTVTEALAGGAHPPTWRILEDLGARQVHFASAADFANINTRDDLALAAARF